MDWKRIDGGVVMCPACGGTEFLRPGPHSAAWIRRIPSPAGVALALDRLPSVPGGQFHRCEKKRCQARFEAVVLPRSVAHPPPVVAA